MALCNTKIIKLLNRQRYKENLYQSSNVNENEKSILRKISQNGVFYTKDKPTKKYDDYAIDKNDQKLKDKNSTRNTYDISTQLLKETTKK